jgi:hypothetical protein
MIEEAQPLEKKAEGQRRPTKKIEEKEEKEEKALKKKNRNKTTCSSPRS